MLLNIVTRLYHQNLSRPDAHPVTESAPDPKQLLAALDANPVDYAAAREVAIALKGIADPAERMRWREAALTRHPTQEAVYLAFADVWARAGMGERVRPREVPELGITLLTRALATAEPSAHRTTIHNNLAFLYNEIGRPDLAEQHARLAYGCTNQIYHLWLAEALFAQGRFAHDPLCVVDFSTFTIPTLQRLGDQASAQWPMIQTDPAKADEFIALVSADSIYFKRFAIALLLSAHATGSRLPFHFHIINPDAEVRRQIDVIRARLPDMRVDFSGEHWPSQGHASDRVYYACSRLLIARQVMERTGANVIIIDADVLFRQAPDALIARDTAAVDLATLVYPGEPLCNRYSATLFAVRRTLPGLFFLYTVEEFLRANLSIAFLWMIDQVALYACEQRIAAVTQGALRTHHWSETTVSIRHLPDSPMWTGATIDKWTDSPYDRLRRSLLIEYGFDPAELEASS